MVRSYTGWIVTAMADVQTIRNRPVSKFPRHPMRPMRTTPLLNPEIPVSAPTPTSSPLPAPISFGVLLLKPLAKLFQGPDVVYSAHNQDNNRPN